MRGRRGETVAADADAVAGVLAPCTSPVGCDGHPAVEDFYVYPEGNPESIGHLQPDLAELLEVAGETVGDIVCSALDVAGLADGH